MGDESGFDAFPRSGERGDNGNGKRIRNMRKVRAFEVDPAPLNNSREISKARGGDRGRAFEERSAPLKLEGDRRGGQVEVEVSK